MQQSIPNNNKRYPQDVPGHGLKIFQKIWERGRGKYLLQKKCSILYCVCQTGSTMWGRQHGIIPAHARMSKINVRYSLSRPWSNEMFLSKAFDQQLHFCFLRLRSASGKWWPPCSDTFLLGHMAHFVRKQTKRNKEKQYMYLV